MTIINLTQHSATADQVAAGVLDVTDQTLLSQLLTINIGGLNGFANISRPVQEETLRYRAREILNAFVLPEIARVVREHFQSLLENEDQPFEWSNVRALNARNDLPVVQCMVGGFHPLMAVLIPMLRAHGAEPLVALSDRVTVEETLPDGTVKKTQVFKHLGFYPA